jgi:hypothetical protein
MARVTPIVTAMEKDDVIHKWWLLLVRFADQLLIPVIHQNHAMAKALHALLMLPNILQGLLAMIQILAQPPLIVTPMEFALEMIPCVRECAETVSKLSMKTVISEI